MPNALCNDRVIANDPTRPVINNPAGDNGIEGGSVSGGVAVSYNTLLLTFAPILFWPLEDAAVGAGQIDQLGSTGGFTGDANTVAPTLQVAGPFPGSFGMTFNGTTQFLSLVTAGAKPSASNLGTIIAWIKGGSLSGYLFSAATASALNLFAFQAGNNGSAFHAMRILNGATNRSSMSTTAAVDGTNWRMLALTASGAADWLMYVDGVAVGTTINEQVGTGTVQDWWSDMNELGSFYSTIGARRITPSTPQVQYGGSLSRISLHDTVLTPANIAALFAATLP